MPEIVIVGAGPAGSTCAAELARAGREVLLVERAAFPRTKVCGEYLNAAAQRELDRGGLADAVGHLAQPIRGIALSAHGMKMIFDFASPAWSLPRSRFDALLLEHALGTGAKMQRGQVHDVRRSEAGFLIAFRDDSGLERILESEFLIGADGIGSVVARKLGHARSSQGGRFAIGGHFRGFERLDGRIEMYIGRKKYFAINPLPQEGEANVMLVMDREVMRAWSDDLQAHMARETRTLTANTRPIDSVELLGKRVAVGPLRQRTKTVADRGAFLVGDAAGFVDPFTGQGVALAMQTGRAAAAALSQPRAEARYRAVHRALFTERKRVGAFVGLLVKSPFLARLAARWLQTDERLRTFLIRKVSGI